ncbi:hypothetical protein SO802_016023 [Lithocarpus litseifolius]|uniref:Zinc knuckle CX2CX4HX4C domain-containing protein n=1 Tax=Lithocarpus litseifolius TaxID=425828 RepID=A0AAW2CVB8_9ROSI
MADELEEFWKKLSFTKEEDESILLGSSTTEAARKIGKNCLVMKINEVEDELYLVEFEDGRDKKRIMETCPWTYEKYLILLREFEGEQVPKDISLWQSSFWVQIHNLPLKSRTRETGRAIGASMGEVLDIDVVESGVHWGKFLRVRVLIDVTKKIVRGKRIVIEGGEQRWVAFKYERLPNFCYHFGLFSHGLKECDEKNGVDEHVDLSKLQYGAWLRGEAKRRGGGDIMKVGQVEGRTNRGWSASKAEGSKAWVTHALEERSGVGNEPGSMQRPWGPMSLRMRQEKKTCEVRLQDVSMKWAKVVASVWKQKESILLQEWKARGSK